MKTNELNEEEKKTVRRLKRRNYIVFGVLVILAAVVLVKFCSYRYWHSFSREKWLSYPEKRAYMASDLLKRHELAGMTKDEVVSLLGQHNNDYGYFSEENRLVYYLGGERTIIDSEWLLIDFENGVVTGYSITTD